jgi:hypothetical protein
MFRPWLPALRGSLCPKGQAAPFLKVPWAVLGKVITAPLGRLDSLTHTEARKLPNLEGLFV